MYNRKWEVNPAPPIFINVTLAAGAVHYYLIYSSRVLPSYEALRSTKSISGRKNTVENSNGEVVTFFLKRFLISSFSRVNA